MNKNHRPQNKSKSNFLLKSLVKVPDSEAAKIWGKGNAGSAKPQNANCQPSPHIPITYNVFGEPISATDALGDTSTSVYTGTITATIGGSITASDVLTLTVQDAGLTGGQLPIS